MADSRVNRRLRARLNSDTPATRRLVLVIVAVQTAVLLPPMLLGAMAVRVRDDLHIDERGLGSAVGIMFGAAASMSVLAGRTAERFGSGQGIRAAAFAVAVALFGLAVVTRDWLTLLPFAWATGVGIAFIQPSTDLWVAHSVPLRRRGAVMGVKQAAGGPVVGLVAGLAAPVGAVTVGWRGVMIVGAGVAVVLGLMIRPGPADPAIRVRRGTTRAQIHVGALVVLAIGGALGSVAQISFVAFSVSSAVDGGMSESVAAVLFALGSGIATMVRIGLGIVSDRWSRSLLMTVASLMLVSAAGFAGMAWGVPWVVGMCIPVLCVTAWGWQGVYFLAVARSAPGAPGTASGIAASGCLVGGVVGPIGFGIVARHSYWTAWSIVGISSLAGAALVCLARLRLEHQGPAAEQVAVSTLMSS